MGEPKISIVMPVYNAENHLHESIESILSQTFTDFEFVIIDDGSTDNSVKIIKSYCNNRIILIENPHNFIRSLNSGINASRGKYVVRMHADDLMLPYRLEIQYQYMENNPSLLAHGSAFIFSNGYTCYKPCDYEQVKIMLLSNNVFLHPSLIIRKEVLVPLL